MISPVAVQQNAQQSESAQMANMAMAVAMTNIFGDERDTLISKWNQIQAFFGSGKGYYNQQGDGVGFDPSNPFCRFKVPRIENHKF